MRSWVNSEKNIKNIGIAREWDSFQGFYDTLGREYPGRGHRLKRINDELDFGPDNCFWQKLGTGVRGVNFHRHSKKFVARIRVDGRVKQVGEYPTLEEAEFALRHGATQ
jgi:hypothetical protein